MPSCIQRGGKEGLLPLVVLQDFPGESRPGLGGFDLADVFMEGVGAGCVKGADGFGDSASGYVMGHYADAGLFNALGQAANGGGNERHFVIGNVAVQDLDAVCAAGGLDLGLVAFETSVTFAGDEQLVLRSELGQSMSRSRPL